MYHKYGLSLDDEASNGRTQIKELTATATATIQEAIMVKTMRDTADQKALEVALTEQQQFVLDKDLCSLIHPAILGEVSRILRREG